MQNLVYISGAVAETAEILRDTVGDSDRLHFTNGGYSGPAEIILPTMLSGFKYLSDNIASDEDVFIVAVNSDVSMSKIMDKKNASAQERAGLENEVVRAEKIALPLAALDPHRPVIVMFYDEETPAALFNQLAELGFNMASLHKWGYGTNPDAPKIEGAHNFTQVFAFPLPNDQKAFCHDITVREDQSQLVKVVDLSYYLTNFQNLSVEKRDEFNYDPSKGRLVFLPLEVPTGP